MTIIQKTIKYFAIALAAVIIVSILSAVSLGIKGIAWITSIRYTSEVAMQDINLESTEVAELNIKVLATSLIIKQGDMLKAETNSTHIQCTQNGDKLEILEKEEPYFSSRNNETLIIYIPDNLMFEQVHITVGAGKIEAESITTKNIYFELGAGKAEFKKLNATESSKIEVGAGKLHISSGELKNLKLELGAGDVNVSSKIVGNSKIDAGIGSLNINLSNPKDNYKLKVNKGIGAIKIDNKEMINGETTGNGENNIDVNGGIGNINIKFE